MSLSAYLVEQSIVQHMRASSPLLPLKDAIYANEAPQGMVLPAIIVVTDIEVAEAFDADKEEMTGEVEVTVFVDDSEPGEDHVRRVRTIQDWVRQALHRQDVSGDSGLAKCQTMLTDHGAVTVDGNIYSATSTFTVYAD